ncbi:porin family protein [Crocinitomicaceae bacterium]|nr:porin family protein [Crocinitomicaceae bacterium]
MKKLFTLLLVTFMSLNYASSQVFNSGSSYASIGYGLGYGFGGVSLTNSSVSNLGPICFSYEYALNDNIGLGVNISYSSTKYDYVNLYEERYTRLGILARGAYHFDILRDVDLYSGIGVGFLSYNFTNSVYDDYDYNFGTPFGYSIFAGARYFFSDAIGAYAEVGYGISVINAGIVLGF